MCGQLTKVPGVRSLGLESEDVGDATKVARLVRLPQQLDEVGRHYRPTQDMADDAPRPGQIALESLRDRAGHLSIRVA
jgi:hypothetical protein